MDRIQSVLAVAREQVVALVAVLVEFLLVVVLVASVVMIDSLAVVLGFHVDFQSGSHDHCTDHFRDQSIAHWDVDNHCVVEIGVYCIDHHDLGPACIHIDRHVGDGDFLVVISAVEYALYVMVVALDPLNASMHPNLSMLQY